VEVGVRTLWNNTLYRIYDADGALLYVGATTNPAARIDTHSRTQPWWPDAANIALEHFASWESLAEAETNAIRTEGPKYNQLHADNPRRKPYIRIKKPGEGTIFQRSSDGLWVGRINVNGRRREVASKDRDTVVVKLAAMKSEGRP
jgi:predicted GIY-YIG superfamily endonuclease